jgi:DNA polymerase-3 subunit delta
MRISSEQLDRHLETGPAVAWLVSGDQPLLAGEAADAIRQRAQRDGYGDREIFFIEPKFDWGQVLGSSQALSLFASRRLLEIRLPTPRPGIEGGKVLAALASDPPPDTVVLVICGRLEGDARSSAWVRAFEQHGAHVQCWPVPVEELPRWIMTRASRRGLRLDQAAATLLAQRVEGNLLAANQEIEKLALTCEERVTLGEDDIAVSVADSARYDVFQLGEAALAGDAGRALRILAGLQAEGTEPPVVLWVLCRELRALAAARQGAMPRAFGRQAERRARLLQQAARRVAAGQLHRLLASAARADRCIKGLARGEPWDELARLTARLAGAPLAGIA